ncbi:hypothetical protein L6164_008682 [Bauhinia variegata]|uniref:Uncharacterized protein n=1 Tax=Bauhinia variegata TaxID=167791 RepID=A0ACB9PGH7_BAUVA|nr:hypothetical protein L6164_008682 [Bauhinia variegata]
MFLIDNVMLWWHRKHVDMQKGLCTIDMWEEFKKELKRQFYPENVVYEASKKLRELRHKTTISDYIRDITTLMLQIPNLSGEDILFYFIDGLQNWAKQELQHHGVENVDEAIAVAESLTEFQRGRMIKATPLSPNLQNLTKEKVGETRARGLANMMTGVVMANHYQGNNPTPKRRVIVVHLVATCVKDHIE